MTGIREHLPGGHPGYPISANALEIFTADGPTGFWSRLLELIRGARRRLSVASLYLGTDAREAELVREIIAALEREPDLRVTIVLDHSRGQRATANGNSATFLSELIGRFPDRVHVSLHRLPQLEGPRGWLPSPFDEVAAVFHFKALVSDDRAIVTGANLSDEYWHCRQARYFAVRDPALIALFHRVVETTARHSLRVGADCTLTPAPAPARNVHQAVLDDVAAGARTDPDADTVVWPLFQHPGLGLWLERDVLTALLAWPDGALEIHSPYMNLPSVYVSALCDRLRAGGPVALLCPSGSSHSFTTGRGPKALVPGVYLHLETALMSQLRAAGPAELTHYHRPGWVFHSKGIWLSTEQESATVIGSSSFGRRSITRDFDLSLLLVTRSPALRTALCAELEALRIHARPPQARAVPAVCRWLAPLARPFL